MRQWNWRIFLICMAAAVVGALAAVLTIQVRSDDGIVVVCDAVGGADYPEERVVVDTEEPITEPVDTVETPVIAVLDSDARLIAQILYYEIGAGTKLEISAVVWTILNRVDSEIPYFPDTIEEVCKQSIKSNGKEVFMFAYKPDAPVKDELYDMAVDVMTRWYREKNGETNVGRTLPVEYVYFWGNGRHNFFRIEYQGNDYWDWSLPDPYEEP